MRSAALLALLVVGNAHAANIVNVPNVCNGWYFRQPVMPAGQPRSPLMVWCPGSSQARLTIEGCFDAKARRDASGKYLISCGGGWQAGPK